ncbi:hypothetical protein ABZS95_36850 [Streptomyces sp. NPDC005479]|uniref:hypothetical protein n=1 Tax=Streptomyces sp. NPDC005479 TaxID=3154879 RepID=UPI0033B27DAC
MAVPYATFARVDPLPATTPLYDFQSGGPVRECWFNWRVAIVRAATESLSEAKASLIISPTVVWDLSLGFSCDASEGIRINCKRCSMGISRRRLLVATETSVVAAGIGVHGAAQAVSPTAGATASTFGLTTLDQALLRGPDLGNGWCGIVLGPGEPHIVRDDLVTMASPQVNRSLVAFAQLSDLHIIDDQSPLRVEFLDRLAYYGPRTTTRTRPIWRTEHTNSS